MFTQLNPNAALITGTNWQSQSCQAYESSLYIIIVSMQQPN